MELRVLGALEVVGEHGPIPLAAAKHRRLLAALTLASGRTRSTDELIDAVWGEAPPASARKLLQVYVSQLRKALPEEATILTRPAGYEFAFPPEALDATRFERLVADAAHALHEGNPPLAASLADRALGLYRGRPYADVAYDDFARDESERLAELALGARELRLRAKLESGAHANVAPELLALAAQHPLRESLQELAILALYRTGRQSEALELFTETRRRLRDELGLEPGPSLRALQRRILEHSSELEDTTTDARVAALPQSPTTLVGRTAELEHLQQLLRAGSTRLITLTGAGGSGKTRLALEVAREQASSYANGAALVELAAIHDPELVVPAVASALGVAEVPDTPPLETLSRVLRPQELLLVVDNAEQVRSAAPAFVELVARAPRLTVLVTSRAVLHVSGEHVFPVGPLPEADAVALFVQRAAATDPRFVLNDETELPVREICRRLDGLPLALELAAARVRVLGVEALLARLSSRLTVLTDGPRDLPARQQTLRETIAWSANLLSERELEVFSALSVFPAGGTFAAAETVAGADLDVLTTLVDHYLVRRDDTAGEPRFTLLETIREYAGERLGRDARTRAVRAALAEWCIELAERAETELGGDRQAEWFARLDAEHDNLRAGLAALEEHEDGERLLTLAVPLFRFWYVRGYLTEGRRWLEQALARTVHAPSSLRRRGFTAAGAIALLQGDYEAATSLAEKALGAARSLDDPRLVANALSNLGAIVLAAGDDARAADVLDEAVELAREVGDERILALALNNRGDVALTTADYARAEPLFAESLALLEARADTANIARSLFNLGSVQLMRGQHHEARARFDESLRLSRAAGDKEDLAWCLEGLAGLAAATGDGEHAGVLLGAARKVLDEMGATFKPFERRLHETTVERATQLCGEETLEAAVERGSALTLDEAILHARSLTPR